MNRSRMISVILMGLMVMFLSSCREIKTATRIFSDGSCERFVTVKGDTSGIAELPYPFQADSTWEKISSPDDKYNGEQYTSWSKRFPSVKALNETLQKAAADSLCMHIHVMLHKRFQWFQTRFIYKETYEKLDPFGHVPVSEFMTPEEIALYKENPDTLDLDDKTDEWLSRNLFEDFYRPFEAAIQSAGNETLTAKVLDMKDTLFVRIKEDDRISLDSDRIDDDVDSLIELMQGLYNTSMQAYRPMILDALEQSMEKLEFLMFAGTTDFKCGTTMPGLILDTNANTIEGNHVAWKPETGLFLWDDYVMVVESRVVNRWALILTGIVGAAILLWFALSYFLRKKSEAAQ